VLALVKAGNGRKHARGGIGRIVGDVLAIDGDVVGGIGRVPVDLDARAWEMARDMSEEWKAGGGAVKGSTNQSIQARRGRRSYAQRARTGPRPVGRAAGR
jgi:hypothetical protein